MADVSDVNDVANELCLTGIEIEENTLKMSS